MDYKHGAYAELGDSIETVSKLSTTVLYVGTAPVHLLKDYSDKIDTPVKVTNKYNAQNKMGYVQDNRFSLTEAMRVHFDNTLGAVGPIYMINVLDPKKHKKDETHTSTLTVSNNKIYLKSNDIIVDSVLVADKTKDVDYEVSYDFSKEAVVISFLEDTTGTVSVSYDEIDLSKVSDNDVIGTESTDTELKGIKAIEKVYMMFNQIVNVLVAPGYSEKPEVYSAMVEAVMKINGHFSAFVLADIPVSEAKTVAKATAFKAEHNYTSEFSKVCWPMIIDCNGNISHLSTHVARVMMETDDSNDNIPYESPSNKEIDALGTYIDRVAMIDVQNANLLNQYGITTANFWSGEWKVWGPHTAAYDNDYEGDVRSIFDSSIRMLIYIMNSFQLDHAEEIDKPLTLMERDSIIANEQEKLDALVSVGALIGDPTVEFVERDDGDYSSGDFEWSMQVTPTPPLKSATLKLSFSDAGYSIYTEEDE